MLTILYTRQRERSEELQNQFELELLIHRPEVYKEYRTNKERMLEENMGFDEIVWRSPESIEELAEVTRAIAEAHQEMDVLDDLEVQNELESLQILKNIDISQLGDLDG